MKLNVYSKKEFDSIMSQYKDLPDNIAVISICNTENDEHFFKYDSSNILNVEFDDVSEEEQGCISVCTAEKIVNFIDDNIGKDFYIHCSAGVSRSQGIARYILDMYTEFDYKTRKDNPCITPNITVTAMLKRIKYNKYYN